MRSLKIPRVIFAWAVRVFVFYLLSAALVSPLWVVHTPAILGYFVLGAGYFSLLTFGTVPSFFILSLVIASKHKSANRIFIIASGIFFVLGTYFFWLSASEDIASHIGPYTLGPLISPMFIDFALLHCVAMGLAVIYRDFRVPNIKGFKNTKGSGWGSDWKKILIITCAVIAYSVANFLITGIFRGIPVAALFGFVLAAMLLEVFIPYRQKIVILLLLPVSVFITWLLDAYLPFLFSKEMRYLEFSDYYYSNTIAIRPANLLIVTGFIALLMFLSYWPRGGRSRKLDFLTKS